MNRLTTRLTAATAGLAACGLVVTGCSAGQISQTATQESAVNGTSANVKDIALRNVHLQAEQTSDFLQPGTVVPLVLVAANNSPDTDDTLLSITSDVGQVALAGTGAVPAAGALVLGPSADPGATPQASGAQGETDPDGPALVTLSEPITNGLTYDFTFTFEKAGRATVAVPVAAGDA
ncbi:MAG: hypothetical protein KDB50_10880 [Mycobacterium sp.]|nr:hypothetical protein [Mycobacterium sp.]